MSDEKNRLVTIDPEAQYYGTFQGVANYHPSVSRPSPKLVIGYPQPIPSSGPIANSQNFTHGYHNIATGYAVVEERPIRQDSLPCCGLGLGWFLFIIGFFLGGIPWYVGTFILFCVQVDDRESPGYVACGVATLLAVIGITLSITTGAQAW